MLEDPAGSLLWRCPPLKRLRRAPEPPHVECVFERCRFGRPLAKSTKLLGTVPWLRQLGRRRRRVHEHERLQSTVLIKGHWVDRTARAATCSAEFASQRKRTEAGY